MIYGFRWRIVIHGGIDGYTRIPVYLKCNDNNRAETVLECVESAVHEYGLPSRVRSDKARENTSVSLYVLQHPLRGPGRGSMITGRAFTIRGLNDYGAIYLKALLTFITTFSIIWRIMAYLIPQAEKMYSRCTTFIFRG